MAAEASAPTASPQALANVSGASECAPPYSFHVPGLFKPGVYSSRSQNAHRVIGSVLLLGVFSWAAFVMQRISLGKAYLMSGCSLALAGAYLGLWVLFFCAPDHISDGQIYAYASRDLVQQQHLAISSLAITAGVLEILWWGGGNIGRGRLSFRHDGWHVLWCMNASMIGVMFLVHPQHDAIRGTVIHTFLGLSMAWAACFLMVSKIKGFPPDLERDFTVIMAGSAQIIACSLLIAYKEPPQEVHYGTEKHCHGAWPITVAAYALALISQVGILGRVGAHRYPTCFECLCGGLLDNLLMCCDSFCTSGVRCTEICLECFRKVFCRPCSYILGMQNSHRGYEQCETHVIELDDVEDDNFQDTHGDERVENSNIHGEHGESNYGGAGDAFGNDEGDNSDGDCLEEKRNEARQEIDVR
mmetsp:Transcript_11371/g.27981  ORF Transcript_11371/g.27981 Transcript_11371/m.27981 type:complete len:415 (-) Transcript_11371:102-1346(-)